MTYEMYAPRAHLRRGALRTHYGDDDDDDDDDDYIGGKKY